MKYKYLFILLACAIPGNVFAQPFLKAQRTGGGSLYDYFTCMSLTKDGGLIAGGYSPSDTSGEKTENSRGVDDYWIVKLDSLGTIEWDKTIGGSSWDRLYAIQQTTDGGYILGGSSLSSISGDKTAASKGEYDYWIVKLDEGGNIIWDKAIGGSSSEDLRTIQQTTDGGYFLGGISWSNKSGDKTQNNRGSSDYWVVKLNSSGTIEWDKTIGGTGEERFTASQQTSDGSYILGGYSQSGISGDKTEHLIGIYDYWVVKINSTGKVEWDNTLGALYGYNFLNSLQQTDDGGYVLAGRSNANISVDKTDSSRGGWDYWIIKLNSAGVKQWDKTIGGTGNENLGALQQTEDGGYVLAGNSSSNISGEKTGNSKGGEDYWIVKLDSLHNIQWDKTIGGSDYDVPKIIKEVSKDHYVIGGYSISGKSGDKNKASRGGVDYWVVALVDKQSEGITNLSQNEMMFAKPGNSQPNNFTAYPNPANNSITITYAAQKSNQYIFEIADLSGRVLLQKKMNATPGVNHATFDVSYFTKGLYFINIIKPDKTKESIRISKG